MPSFIAKQPNGLYCRYSTIVDGFTHTDMTKHDYIMSCMKKAKLEAEEVLEKYLVDYEYLMKLKNG